VRQKGLDKLKNPMGSLGKEPTTFPLVTVHLMERKEICFCRGGAMVFEND
jgi:hypothetical protein